MLGALALLVGCAVPLSSLPPPGTAGSGAGRRDPMAEINAEAVAHFLEAQLVLQSTPREGEVDDRAARAAGLLRSAIAREPKAAPLWRYLAEAQALIPDHREAILAAQRSLALDETDPRAHWVAGSQLREIGRNEEAEPHLVAAAAGGLDGDERYLPHYMLYQLRREQGRTDDALAALKTWAQSIPDDRYPHGLMHRLLWEAGRFAEGRDAAVEVLRRSPTDKDARDLLDRFYELDPDGKIATYEELLRSDWSVPALHLAIGTAYGRLGRYDRALEHVDWLRVLGRTDPAKLLEAEVGYLLKMHRPEDARLRLEEAWPEELDSATEVRLLRLGADARRQERRWDQAIEAYRAIPTEGLPHERGKIAGIIASIRLEQGRPDLAVREAVAALGEVDPRDESTQARLLGLMIRADVRKGDFDEARTALGRLRAVAPPLGLEYEVLILDREGKAEEAKERLRARLAKRRNDRWAVQRLSGLLAAQGDFEGAREAMDGAIEPIRGLVRDLSEAAPSPDSLERLNNSRGLLVGLLLHAAGLAQQSDEWDRSEALLVEARGLAPNDATVRNTLAYTYALRETKLDEAAELIDAALEHQPFNGALQDTLGWVRYKQGDHEGARAALEKAVSYTPGHTEILAHLAEVLAELGETRAARRRYEEALREADEHDAYERKIAETVRESLRALGATAGR